MVRRSGRPGYIAPFSGGIKPGEDLIGIQPQKSRVVSKHATQLQERYSGALEFALLKGYEDFLFDVGLARGFSEAQFARQPRFAQKTAECR